jgi:hypothetical protein
VALTTAQLRGQAKAEKIAAADEARTANYQSSLTAAPKTPAQQSALSAVSTQTANAILTGREIPDQNWQANVKEPGKTVREKKDNKDGTFTIIYDDGTSEVIGDKTNIDSGSEMQDAYQRLYDEFNLIGLGALVADGKDLLMKATSISSMPDALRSTKAYMTRFSANDDRIKAGLSALTPAEYLDKEDAYQKIMRNYGLPASYYKTGLYGKQEGFDKLLANDVSSVELEDRISTAQQRVLYSNPEVSAALKKFYPDITDGDILAYVLNPTNGLKDIQRKVTAAEIGGAAMAQTDAMGKPILTTSEARARELAGYGVDKAAATEGYSAIGGGLQRGSELASIYGQSPYTQATAESEIFKLSGQQEARKQRQKVTGLEKATFGGQSGVTSGALARDRAGGY